MYFISLVLENLVLSMDNNEDLIYCLKVSPNEINLEFVFPFFSVSDYRGHKIVNIKPRYFKHLIVIATGLYPFL